MMKLSHLFGDYETDHKYVSYLRQATEVGSCLDIRVTGVRDGKCEFGVFVSRGTAIKKETVLLLFASPHTATDVASADADYGYTVMQGA